MFGKFKQGLVVLLVLALVFALSGPALANEKVNAVATYSIVYDLVKSVGGERVEVESIVPVGAAPEEYSPVPADMLKVAEAEIVFYNGFGIERWFEELIDSVASEQMRVKTIEGVEPFYLGDSSFKGEPDPHAWFNPILIRDYYVSNIKEALIEIDPEGADYYQERATEYQQQLTELHEWIEEELAQLEPEDRVLITSEGAFRYFCETYDFEEGFIWEINAHEEGTPQQIAELIMQIRNMEVAAVFTESSVDSRPMERVAEETGVSIGGVLYSDSLGSPDSEAATYLEMMEYNVNTIVEALKGGS
ncbi:metal ABC transporter solute-binding protein, Zn/Mn family [Fuchsiella alkaliacetigena]|uniref:metal ABC transporter solute-binding protein, Zn/Mn family n=1 Tax=Fuchsiella alkaliacetigena TaxID=957042 RepID=UPI00200B680C|nr:zinc ABC transporter substrate-binding protein [Fuchsiella alkaliacetigena]MCK8825201.1 zinc ABC transporter substrate-binding protein [Fuchsiella alkaliacetigena]